MKFKDVIATIEEGKRKEAIAKFRKCNDKETLEAIIKEYNITLENVDLDSVLANKEKLTGKMSDDEVTDIAGGICGSCNSCHPHSCC